MARAERFENRPDGEEAGASHGGRQMTGIRVAFDEVDADGAAEA
jgi:hypothetical protein